MSILLSMSELTTIKLLQGVRDRLKAYADRSGRTLGEELEHLLDRRDEEAFWSAAHESMHRLQADPRAWQEYLAELDAWDTAAGDGLADAIDEWPEYQQPEYQQPEYHRTDRP